MPSLAGPGRLRALAAAAAVVGLGACSEQLAAPVDCPALCPGGQIVALDTVLLPAVGGDSSFSGYVDRLEASAMLVSTPGFAPLDSRGVVRFGARPSTVTLSDTARPYTIDSVAVSFSLLARDSLLRGVALELFRLPATVNAAAPFGEVAAAQTSANRVALIPLADSVQFGRIRVVFRGDSLPLVAIPAADSGVLALGVGLVSATPTGLRLASIPQVGAQAPQFVTYARLSNTDSARVRQNIEVIPEVATYVTPGFPAPPPGGLAVGGAPSSRVLLRFDLPRRIRDSSAIARATLEVTPVGPVRGLRTDPGVLVVRPVVADLGAKSPFIAVRSVLVPIPADTTGTLRFEIAPFADLWSGPQGRRPVFYLTLINEAGTFTSLDLHSSGSPGLQPRLRLTYVPLFPFANP